jgi:hypothetical protein
LRITFYFGNPLYIFSPGIRVYCRNQVLKTEGYLANFHPEGMGQQEVPSVADVVLVQLPVPLLSSGSPA